MTPPSAFAPPPLYAILDVDACAAAGRNPLDTARALVDGGARLLQLRAKTLAGGAFLELARALAALARDAGATLIVNDRVDIAKMVGAGVHVGQEDLPAADARALLGPRALVGLSTHTEDQVRAALEQPVDYLAIGPVFATGTKDTGYAAVGLTMVAQAARLARARGLPVVAIGGITRATAASVIASGAAAVAVIGDLLRDDPAAAAREFQRILGQAP